MWGMSNHVFCIESFDASNVDVQQLSGLGNDSALCTDIASVDILLQTKRSIRGLGRNL